MTFAARSPLPVWIVSALVLLFLVLPIFIVVPISFSSATYLQFPPAHYSLRWYDVYFGTQGWFAATLLSAKIAVVVMILATALGTAAAFALVRAQFPGKSLLYGFLLSPLIVPTIITAIAVYFLFAKLHLIGNWLGLVLAHTVLAIPLVVVVVSASLSGFNVMLERAAMSLGAAPWQALRRVTLPIIAPGIVTAALLAFLASFDEVVIAIFIAGSGAVTLPKKMWDGLWLEITPAIAAASTFVIAVTIILFVAMELLRRRSERVTLKRSA
ncbi:MAG TPA: ABC transporter permease [Alphaproteobacteria bacterium]|nr:ABC transporter permease [Alphaproteobacteria bacterium]